MTIVGTVLSPVITYVFPTFWLLSKTDFANPLGKGIAVWLCWFNQFWIYGYEPPGDLLPMKEQYDLQFVNI